MFTATQLGQIVLFLLLCAVQSYLIQAKIGMGAVGKPYRGTGPGNFLHRNGVSKIAHTAAAVGIGYGDAQQTKASHFCPQFARKVVVAVDIRGAGRNFVSRELVYALAQQAYFVRVAVL